MILESYNLFYPQWFYWHCTVSEHKVVSGREGCYRSKWRSLSSQVDLKMVYPRFAIDTWSYNQGERLAITTTTTNNNKKKDQKQANQLTKTTTNPQSFLLLLIKKFKPKSNRNLKDLKQCMWFDLIWLYLMFPSWKLKIWMSIKTRIALTFRESFRGDSWRE